MVLKNRAENVNSRENMFCELTKNDMLNIDGGKNVFHLMGYYVGRIIHYYCEGVSHIYG